MRFPPPAPAAPCPSALHCLLAPRQLSRLLRLRDQLPRDPGVTPDALAEAWRAAAAVWRELSTQEAGRADRPEVQPLPPAWSAHLQALVASESVRRTFDVVPVAFGLVPVDQLVVSQFTLTQDTVAGLGAAPGVPPDGAELMSLCLPLDGGDAPSGTRLAYRGTRELVFVSETHDMRLLDVQVIDPAELAGLGVRGHLEAVAGLCVGQSTNLVNVLRFGERLVLNNGHHRVHALRQRGVSHVPALIQVCGSREEFDEVAPREVRDNGDLYFQSPRPPLLRDFDDPRLTLRLPTPRLRRELRIKFEIESRMVAE